MIQDICWEKVQCEASQLKMLGRCPNFFYRKAKAGTLKKYCSTTCQNRATSTKYRIDIMDEVNRKKKQEIRYLELERLRELYK